MFKALMVVVTALFFTNHAQATVLPKDTLTVERVIIVNNGTSSGKSITSHVFTKRFFTEADCITARDAYRAEKLMKIGANDLNADVGTRADCDALDHRFEIQYQ